MNALRNFAQRALGAWSKVVSRRRIRKAIFLARDGLFHPWQTARNACTLAGTILKSTSESWLAWRYKLPEVDLVSFTGHERRIKPAIMDQICLPYQKPEERTPQDRLGEFDDFGPLMSVLSALDPRLVLELGTAHGNTTANMCFLFPNLKVITVNAPPETISGYSITFALPAEEIGIVYKNHGLSNRVIQVLQNTLDLDLTGIAEEGSVDLAIIDACHDFAFVINDFEKVRKYIRPKGIVVFHDTHRAIFVGSYLACAELRRRGFEVRHLRDTWWGIWINGKFEPIPDASKRQDEKNQAKTDQTGHSSEEQE